MSCATTRFTVRQSGFTLLELLFVLSLFSLLSVMAYQTIVDVVRAKTRIQSQVDTQAQRRLAHRALQSAMNSGAHIFGNRLELQLLFGDQDSTWPSGVDSARIRLDSTGRMLSTSMPQGDVSILMTGLEQAEFRYIQGGSEYSRWELQNGQNLDNPEQLVFSWRQAGAVEQWRFAVR